MRSKFDEQLALMVYDDSLMIEYPDQYDVNIYNIEGQCLFFNRFQGEAVIPLNSQKKGLIIIKVTTLNHTFIKKILL